jgi:hypothetical protein
MSGFITKREVIRHGEQLVRAYGFGFVVKCLFAPKGSTFLGMLIKEGKI